MGADELRILDALLFNRIYSRHDKNDLKGTGGLRKVRFSFPDSGKNGSVRVCYIDMETVLEIHLIDVFAKNEKDNLSMAERNAVKAVVEQIKAERIRQKR